MVDKTSRRNFVRGLATGAVASISLPSIAHASDKKKVRLKMQTYWGKEVGDIFKVLSNDVKVASDGNLKIKVYEGSSIVPDADMLDAVSKGTLDMCQTYAGYYPGKLDLATIESGMAGAWTSIEEARYIFEHKFKPLLQEAYSEHNIHYLNTAFGGAYDLVTNKPVKSLGDLKNMKIRATPTVAKILQQFGIATVFMPASELYIGLSTGAIDGVIYGGPIEYFNMKLFEVAKYYTHLNMIHPGFTDSILVNKNKWDSLDKAQQKILELAVSKSSGRLYDVMMEGQYNPKYSEKFEFSSLPPKDSQLLRDAAQVLWSEEAKKSSRNKEAIDFLIQIAKKRG